jgi:hypothetical protein
MEAATTPVTSVNYKKMRRNTSENIFIHAAVGTWYLTKSTKAQHVSQTI